jgi:hypothetical protein
MNVNNAVYEITKLIAEWKERKEVKIQLSSMYGKFAK